MNRMILIVGLLMTLKSAGAPWPGPPIGVPDPRWGDTLHPITTPTPDAPQQWPAASVAGYYYVDSGHPAATDTSNSYGYPERPRKTIPSTLAAGSKVFVARCATNLVLGAATGVVTNPVWIIGTGAALFQTAKTGKAITVSGISSYVIMDGIAMDGTGAPDTEGSGGFTIQNGANHICIRNCIVRNYVAPPYNPTRFAGGGAGAWYLSLNTLNASTKSISDVVIYNLRCVGNSGGQNLDYENGRHAVHILADIEGAYSTKNVWILNSELFDNSEDAIQVGQTSGSSVQTACSLIYIGGNVITANGENAIDLKACDKIVVSQNIFQGYKTTIYREGATSGSDGTACVINDDGNGPLESWWLFNRFTECHGGIRNQAAGGKHYIIGNVVDKMQLEAGDAPTSGGYGRGTFYWQSAGSADVFLVNNTVYDVEGGFYLHNVGNAFIWGNIVSGIRNNGIGYPVYINNSSSISVGENFYFDPDSTVRRDGDALSVADGDRIDVNPELRNPPGDMDLSLSSPARKAASATPVYATYEATFGKSIRFGYNGNPRPTNSPWDSGAMQAGQTVVPPIPEMPEIIKPK